MKRTQRVSYFLESLWNYRRADRRLCPNCGYCGPHERVEAKYVVTVLAECPQCRLRFRIPTDAPGFNETYYQENYSQGSTTDCPDEKSLNELKRTGFKGHEKDFSRFIRLIGLLDRRPGLRILDFGCSWGYGAWQFIQAGYQVIGHELSQPRSRFAQEKLGIRVLDDFAQHPGVFDVFFSSHVLEHVPSVKGVWTLALQTLKPGGLFVAVTPNGSEEYRRESPALYAKAWGKVHPNMIGCNFYENLFANRAYILDSTPWDFEAIGRWDKNAQVIVKRKGRELLAIALKKA